MTQRPRGLPGALVGLDRIGVGEVCACRDIIQQHRRCVDDITNSEDVQPHGNIDVVPVGVCIEIGPITDDRRVPGLHRNHPVLRGVGGRQWERV